MGIALSKLMEDIGNSVQNANAAIERYAAEVYLAQGYAKMKADEQNMTGKTYEPITYKLNLTTAGGKKKIEVPVTALMQHSSLQLEQVNVKLRFSIEEGDGEEVRVRVNAPGEEKDSELISELSMQFRTAPPAEGVARIENRHIQTL